MAGCPQYEFMFAIWPPASIAMTRPSPTLFGGDNGLTS